jgi:hypothetical protein
MVSFVRQSAFKLPKRERNKAFVLERLRELARRVEEGAAMRMLP